MVWAAVPPQTIDFCTVNEAQEKEKKMDISRRLSELILTHQGGTEFGSSVFRTGMLFSELKKTPPLPMLRRNQTY